MVIKLSGVQFGLKSYDAQRECDLKSQVWFQNKTARHEVKLPQPFWNRRIQSVQERMS